jgi:peptide/nickel transport system substrate-binding protein
MKIRQLGALVAIAITSSLLAGCVSTTATPSTGAQSDGAITIAMASEPPNTDPIMTRSISAWNIYYAVYDGLTRITAEGAIEPGLATSWKHNDDLSQWDFTIRDGVTFHNGDALTASDVVYTYKTILGAETSTNRVAIGMVEGVEEVEDGVVRFTLKNPFSAWLNQVATIGIVPEKVYSELGDDFVNEPVGTGPFSFVSWKRGVSYEVKRNDEYWGDKAGVEKVTFSFVGAEDARVTGVESGTLDAAAISASQIAVLKGSKRATVISSPSNQVMFVGVNTTAGVLKDERVRQAISMAIDRDALIKQLLGGKGVANGQLVAEGVTGHVKDVPLPTFDVEAAKKLLADAGYKGEEITFEYATVGGDPMSTEIAQAVQGFLAKVGVKVRLVGSESTSLSLKLANHQITGLYLTGWAPSSMDGDVVVSQLLAGGPEDYARDPQMAKLYLDQQSAGEAERAEVYKQIWELNQERVYHIPLYTNYYSFAANPALKWAPAADGIYRATDFAIR